MSEFVQATIKYWFTNDQLLEFALKAAHRNKEDGVSDDGNRGLARIGVCAIDMVETHNAIVVENRTSNYTNSRDHWSKCKEGRATACRSLGFGPCIKQSARQNHQPPSAAVLDNALSAVFGAIWLDCKQQEKSTAETQDTIYGVLRQIDAILVGVVPTQNGENKSTQETRCSPHTPSYEATQNTAPDISPRSYVDDLGNFIANWFDDSLTQIPEYTPAEPIPDIEAMLLDPGLETRNNGDPVSLGEFGQAEFSMHNRNNEQLRISPTSTPAAENTWNTRDSEIIVPSAKRKRALHSGQKACLTYSILLAEEQEKLNSYTIKERIRLGKFLQHPQNVNLDAVGMMNYQFMFLAIGSSQTLYDFGEQLKAARIRPAVYTCPHVGPLSVTERYQTICQLDNEEALCILRRRYHMVKICETEYQDSPQRGRIILESPGISRAVGSARKGNPAVMYEAGLTNELLYRVKPGAVPGTPEYRKDRQRVRNLRKVAKFLQILITTYGIGILALLPSGSSYSELPLTDNMLCSMTEQKFRAFASLLHQEQGSLLLRLSAYVTPAVLALVTHSMDPNVLYHIEHMDMERVTEFPKGNLHRLIPGSML